MEIKKSNFINFQKLLIQSFKLPVVLLILGAVLSLLACVPPFCSSSLRTDQVIDILNTFGNVLMTLSWVIFLYLITVNLLQAVEDFLSQEGHKILAHILTTIRKASRIIFIFFALDAIFSIFEVKYHYVKIFDKITTAFIIASFAWLFLQIITMIEVLLYNNYTAQLGHASFRPGGFNYIKIRQLKNIVSALVIVVAISASFMLFEPVRNVGISILASATFLTAILIFSAQKTLGSMCEGIKLAFSKRLQIGDVLTIENEQGTVEEINLSYVIVKISDAKRLTIPINYFLEKPIQNWSLNNEYLQVSIPFYVDFYCPIEELRKELKNLLNASPLWNKKIGVLNIVNIKEDALELRAAISANSIEELDALRTEIREKLLNFIIKNYPQYLPKTRYSLTK